MWEQMRETDGRDKQKLTVRDIDMTGSIQKIEDVPKTKQPTVLEFGF